MKVFPCAKINLGLNVVSRRADGYHNLETVFYPVAIYDELEVEQLHDAPVGTGCQLTLKGAANLCAPADNLVVRAYNLISQHHQLPPVKATLTKGIPSQAGMGGGSSDAAFMIRLLNEQFNLGLSASQMRQYAAMLGADCAFFIEAQPAYATGIGDVLEPCSVPHLEGQYLALVKPDVAVSTAQAYAGITPRAARHNCRDVVALPVAEWRDVLVNDFEEGIFQKLPILCEVKEQMYANGAEYAAMSGSGSTIFGIFAKEPDMTQFAGYYNKVIAI